MKIKSILLAISALFIFRASIGVSAQLPETDWTPLFSSPLTSNADQFWSEGTFSDGGVQLTRVINEGGYQWTMVNGENRASWLVFLVDFGKDQALKYDLSISLPSISPYACTGMIVDGQETGDKIAFSTMMICNDQTYSLQRYEDGQWRTALPFKAIANFDQGKKQKLSLVLKNGWVEMYLNNSLLDTYNIQYQNNLFGMIMQPLSSVQTEAIFSDLTLSAAPLTVEAGGVSADASASVARTLKTLELKGRVDSITGIYSAFEDRELSLAQMGAFQFQPMDMSAADLLLQADISWKSAFKTPDYQNSGCGLIFRRSADNSYIRAYIALDGNIYLTAVRNGAIIPIMTYTYGNNNIEGKGKLSIVASSNKISILFNENLLGTVSNATWMGTGDVGLVVMSGTNYDYGTRCSFSEIEAYQLEAAKK